MSARPRRWHQNPWWGLLIVVPGAVFGAVSSELSIRLMMSLSVFMWAFRLGRETDPRPTRSRRTPAAEDRLGD